MDIKEAIENIDNRVHCAMVEYNTSPEHDAYDEESLAIAIEAMKKQEPMKPVDKETEYACGQCDTHVAYKDDYCWKCGQKLDWED